MSYSKKLVILYDLDGTLIDSSEGIFESYCKALKQVGFKNTNDISKEEFKTFIGPPMNVMIKGLQPNQSVRSYALAVKQFNDIYNNTGWKKFTLIPGSKKILNHYRDLGVEQILVTNKKTNTAKKILNEVSISKYFSLIAGRDYYKVEKESKEYTLHKLISQKRFSGLDKYYIGDTLEDAVISHRLELNCLLTLGAFNHSFEKLITTTQVNELNCLCFNKLEEIAVYLNRRYGLK